MNLTFKVNGLQKVSRILLKTLPDEAIKQLSAAVKGQAQADLAIAQSLIPVKTGQTKAQLKIRYSAKGLRAQIGVLGDRGYIGRFLDLGTKPHSTASGAVLKRKKFQNVGPMHPGMPPHPFLIEPTRAPNVAFAQKLRQKMIDALKKANDELRS